MKIMMRTIAITMMIMMLLIAMMMMMMTGMWARGWRRGSFLKHERTWLPSKRIMRR